MLQEFDKASVPQEKPKPRIQVTAAVIESEGRVLIARRGKNSARAGKWEFPGGKIRSGEPPEECLARELMEEFSLASRIGAFIGSNEHEYDDIIVELLAYRAVLGPGPITLNAHQEIQWVSPEEFDRYDFAEADIPFAELLKRCATQVQ